jgi:hypothetical protein
MKKQYYTIEIQAIVPTVIKYKVLAESPEEALNLPINFANCTTKPMLARLKRVLTKVFENNTSIAKIIKK